MKISPPFALCSPLFFLGPDLVSYSCFSVYLLFSPTVPFSPNPPDIRSPHAFHFFQLFADPLNSDRPDLPPDLLFGRLVTLGVSSPGVTVDFFPPLPLVSVSFSSFCAKGFPSFLLFTQAVVLVGFSLFSPFFSSCRLPALLSFFRSPYDCSLGLSLLLDLRMNHSSTSPLRSTLFPLPAWTSSPSLRFLIVPFLWVVLTPYPPQISSSFPTLPLFYLFFSSCQTSIRRLFHPVPFVEFPLSTGISPPLFL